MLPLVIRIVLLLCFVVAVAEDDVICNHIYLTQYSECAKSIGTPAFEYSIA